MLESDAVGTENRKDTRTVGGGHGGCHQEGEPDGNGCHRMDPTEEQMDDEAGDDAGE